MGASTAEISQKNQSTRAQFSTFVVADRLYGIDVTRVQEVVRPMAMTRIPLAQAYVAGLINLRGQVATAIHLREMFELPEGQRSELMNVICKCDGSLVSLLVDNIGDVVEVSQDSYEPTPSTVPNAVRRFMAGVYKTDGALLSIIDIDHLSKFLNR